MTQRLLNGLRIAALAGLGMLAPAMLPAETLSDALVSAYRTSNLLEQNRATLRAADEDVAQAVAALRPVLQWSAGYNYSRSDTTTGSSARDLQTASAQLAASMTLFDFGRNRLSLDITKETVLSTREALRGIEQNVLLSAIQAYTQVRSAAEQVSINENSVRVYGEELKATRDRFEAGEVTRTDVSQAEAAEASARASLAAARGNYQIAREAYRATVGHYPGDLAALPKPPQLPKTLELARGTAERNNPSVKQAQHNVTIAELSVQAAAAQRLPQISGSAGFGNSEGGRQTTSAGISLSQTIYSGGQLSSLHRQSIANRERARAALRQAVVEISNTTAQAWAMIDVYRAQIQAYAEQIAAAEVAYQGVREEASLGSRTTLDVLDSEQTLLDARASRINAEADLQVGYYQLLLAMGLLTVEDLKLGIPTYDPAAYYNAVRNAPGTSVQGKSLDRVLKAIGKP
ncbi:TolC family outer membrane protein [Paenirhodobacter populi]|uniref:Transporter n=1 Tax=Paenirhodobacter populi TaxID=2306993 RepID=A0A443IVU4_9RHOB|nr:TolC family outer membrane protein [Sinirhodobacter populi]RWR12249.1 transporter [Sinirhodobacter populi]